MMIPSIDLMAGKVVQLVQGRRKALEFEDLEVWIERFASYPIVQVIDLDAAMGRGDNREAILRICRRLPCQVGGGVRSLEGAQALLAGGARKLIIGSALVREGCVHVEFARSLAGAFGPERLLFAVDSRNGYVATQGWRIATALTPLAMIRELEPFCGAFLYTHIDSEGLMAGIPIDVVRALKAATSRRLVVAGGIRTKEEVDALHQLGVDAVVGMAIYSGAMTA